MSYSAMLLQNRGLTRAAEPRPPEPPKPDSNQQPPPQAVADAAVADPGQASGRNRSYEEARAQAERERANDSVGAQGGPGGIGAPPPGNSNATAAQQAAATGLGRGAGGGQTVISGRYQSGSGISGGPQFGENLTNMGGRVPTHNEGRGGGGGSMAITSEQAEAAQARIRDRWETLSPTQREFFRRQHPGAFDGPNGTAVKPKPGRDDYTKPMWAGIAGDRKPTAQWQRGEYWQNAQGQVDQSRARIDQAERSGSMTREQANAARARLEQLRDSGQLQNALQPGNRGDGLGVAPTPAQTRQREALQAQRERQIARQMEAVQQQFPNATPEVARRLAKMRAELNRMRNDPNISDEQRAAYEQSLREEINFVHESARSGQSDDELRDRYEERDRQRREEAGNAGEVNLPGSDNVTDPGGPEQDPNLADTYTPGDQDTPANAQPQSGLRDEAFFTPQVRERMLGNQREAMAQQPKYQGMSEEQLNAAALARVEISKARQMGDAEAEAAAKAEHDRIVAEATGSGGSTDTGSGTGSSTGSGSGGSGGYLPSTGVPGNAGAGRTPRGGGGGGGGTGQEAGPNGEIEAAADEALLRELQRTEPELVEDRLNDLLASDSRYMSQARKDALVQAARSGLGQSGLAAGAAQTAAIRAGFNIASQDAGATNQMRGQQMQVGGQMYEGRQGRASAERMNAADNAARVQSAQIGASAQVASARIGAESRERVAGMQLEFQAEQSALDRDFTREQWGRQEDFTRERWGREDYWQERTWERDDNVRHETWQRDDRIRDDTWAREDWHRDRELRFQDYWNRENMEAGRHSAWIQSMSSIYGNPNLTPEQIRHATSTMNGLYQTGNHMNSQPNDFGPSWP